MIYVYIKNWWIIKKSEDIINGLSYDDIQWVDYDIKDKLIYEWWKVVKYTESKQYRKDYNIDTIEEENTKLRYKNEELTWIVNNTIKEDKWVARWEEPTEYKRKLYILKSIRWLQQ